MSLIKSLICKFLCFWLFFKFYNLKSIKILVRNKLNNLAIQNIRKSSHDHSASDFARTGLMYTLVGAGLFGALLGFMLVN